MFNRNIIIQTKFVISRNIPTIFTVSLLFAIALSTSLVYLKSWIGVGYDDAFITFRYAQNLGNGIGFRFNSGSDVNSASPLLFGLLLGTIGKLGIFSISNLALTLNVIGLFGIIAGITMWSVTENSGRIAKTVGILLGVSITSSGFLGYWMLSGMETIFCAGLLTISIYLFKSHIVRAAEGSAKSISILSLNLLILGTARLELSITAIALGSWFFIAILLSRNPTDVDKGSKKHWKIGLIPLLSAFFSLIFTLLFYRFYYYNVIPDPVRFKQIVNYYISDPKSQWLITKSFVATHFGYVGLAAAASSLFLVFRFRRNLESFASLAPLIALISLAPSILSSPKSDFYRYQIFLIPLIGLLASSIFKKMNNKTTVLIFACLFLFFSFKTVNQGLSDYVTMRNIALADKPIQSDRAIVGKWLEQNTPAGSTVWSGDLGAISFNNPSNQYFDGGGLTNRQVIEAVEIGSDYSAVLCAARPSYVADSIDIDSDLPGVVWILDNLSSYYSMETGNASTSRNSKELFTLTKVFSTSGNGAIGVGAYRINWFGC
jgi:hypothetical protein